VKFSVRPSILLNNKECSPLGGTKWGTSPLGDKFHPWGKFTPVGKFTHRVEIHPWGPISPAFWMSAKLNDIAQFITITKLIKLPKKDVFVLNTLKPFNQV
jgi:hypothetical protein